MFVKNDTSIDKNFNGRWELSSRCQARKFCSFPEEDKTIEVENTNGKTFDTR
jgi:hypothetical protein